MSSSTPTNTPLNPKDPPDEGEEADRVKAWLEKVGAPKTKVLPRKPEVGQIRRKFMIRCALLAATFIVLALDDYRHGLFFDTTGIYSSWMFLALAINVFFILTLISGIQIIRAILARRLLPKNLLLLLLLPATFLIARASATLDFTDGATRTLKKLGISDELVTAAAKELAKPHDRYHDWSTKDQLWLELKKKHPFSKLDLSYPHLRILGSSLVFEFGSPLAKRWGFSISSEKNKSPSTPKDSFNHRIVSKEIIVFAGPAD